ncbi:MAG: trypsin-like peptidase domain-containing protein [Ardenticatenales bacterium]|nr:trypsin-like peptidase domain-containing protein [Ardenticatenales bacterium]
MKITPLRFALMAMLLVAFMTACGGGAQPAPATTTPEAPSSLSRSTEESEIAVEPTTGAEPTDEPEATAESSDPLLVNNVQDVKSAVVQIVAEGSFTDAQVGEQLNVAGSGSGFIIDPSGIAVTNNHVVTGAALLRVYVAGESTPRNARVLGVSECSDLAVIDIEGDDFPYVEWIDEPVEVGLDVYAAGFPLGDPEFTLTRGIISKANANGESSWASLDSVLEHDATINPGNSGGPLVTDAGKVVGVNYASSGDTNQYYAINDKDAQGIIDQLREGSDVSSIGINGTAVSDEVNSLYGIWVASVQSGSPADRAGISPGDIITRLENFVLATDGTMADYCDILRSHSEEDIMRVEVLRYDSQQVLEGQLNGEPLVVTTDFSQALVDEVDPSDDSAPAYEYTAISDDSGVLQVEVPTSWNDIDGSAWVADDGTELGPAITAAPDIESYSNTWNTPGMEFVALTSLDSEMSIDELLSFFDYADQCNNGGRYDYEDPLYTGQYDVWEACGGSDTILVVLATQPADGSFYSVVVVQAVTDADLEALDQILNTFIVAQ